MESKYDIPADPQARKKLLEDLLSGAKTLDSIEQDSIDIQLNLHPTDQERAEFAQHLADQDNLQGDSNTIYFTVSMPAFTGESVDPGYLQQLAPVVTDNPLPKQVNRTEPGPNQASDTAYWDSLFNSGSSDRLDRVSNHLRDMRSR